MNLKKYLSWKTSHASSLKSHFWDDVYIEDKKLKLNIMAWVVQLKLRKNISLTKFSDLFSKYEEIVFPITVSGTPKMLKIKDNSGNEFYLDRLDYSEFGEYTIGKRVYPYDTSFIFIAKNNSIQLKEVLICQLTKNGKNSDVMLHYYYNTIFRETTAVLKTSTLHLEIISPSSSLNYFEGNSNLEYLFCLATHWEYFYDVHPILHYISNLFKNNFSVHIKSYANTNYDKKLLSEVKVVDGLVTRFSYTRKSMHSGTTSFTTESPNEDFAEFMLNHNEAY